MEGLKFGHPQSPHGRTILYIETDLLSKKADYSDKPTAVRGEQEIMACNKAARDLGIFEKMPIVDAVATCPGLILLQLDQVREFNLIADEVTRILKNISPLVARIDLDHCYVDVSEHPLVINGEPQDSHKCDAMADCKCYDRINAGNKIANDLLSTLQSSVHTQCRIGVSYSKLLARLACAACSFGTCKPLFPEEFENLLSTVDARSLLPEYVELLPKEVRSIRDFRKAGYERLSVPSSIKNVASIDSSNVVPCDYWRAVTVEGEVKSKFRSLLRRLLQQIASDGRTPLVVKVSVRKYDPARSTCVKEAKTSPIPSTAISLRGQTSLEGEATLLNIIMSLFRRLINFAESFQLTLLGLGFIRFQESSVARSVASCILKKRELSAQMVVSIGCQNCIPNTSPFLSRRRVSTPANSDISDCEDVAPVEKKAKLDIVIKKRKFKEEDMDLCSPSKLKVGDLSLNSDDGPHKTNRPCSFVATRWFH